MLETTGWSFLHFVAVGRTGTAYDGQVFRQKDYATVSYGGTAISVSEAATPFDGDTYYTELNIDFDIDGNDFQIDLDTGDWGGANGFAPGIPIPAVPAVGPTAYLVLAAGLAAAGAAEWRRRRRVSAS